MTDLHGTDVPDNKLISLTLFMRKNPNKPVAGLEKFNTASHSDDHDDVKEWCQKHGLTLMWEDQFRRSIKIQGTMEQIRNALGLQLVHDVDPKCGLCHKLSENSKVTVPKELEGVEHIIGFDTRPLCRPYFRAHTSADGGYWPDELAALYKFPAGRGKGKKIAIIELGGGFDPNILANYWQQVDANRASKGLPPLFATSQPKVVAHGVDGAANAPGDPADGEVLLDIGIVGVLAPDCEIHVVFAPNTSAGFLDAVTYSIHTIGADCVSISWGSPESNYEQGAPQAMDSAAADGLVMHCKCLAASGDNGSGDGGNGVNADFPSSGPHFLGCGATRVSSNGAVITQEVVWNEGGGATGGGFSNIFAKPTYQAAITGIKRMVPDWALNGAPSTGWEVPTDNQSGQVGGVGGTSSDAPALSALIVLVEEAIGKPVEDWHSFIYAHSEMFNDITVGNNGAYIATVGPDPCTGMGTPKGDVMLTIAKTGTGGNGNPPPPPPPPPVTKPSETIHVTSERKAGIGGFFTFSGSVDYVDAKGNKTTKPLVHGMYH